MPNTRTSNSSTPPPPSARSAQSCSFALCIALEGCRAHSRHAAVDTLRAAENQLLREEVEQLEQSDAAARRLVVVVTLARRPARRSGARSGAAVARRAAERARPVAQGVLAPRRGVHLVHAMT